MRIFLSISFLHLAPDACRSRPVRLSWSVKSWTVFDTPPIHRLRYHKVNVNHSLCFWARKTNSMAAVWKKIIFESASQCTSILIWIGIFPILPCTDSLSFQPSIFIIDNGNFLFFLCIFTGLNDCNILFHNSFLSRISRLCICNPVFFKFNALSLICQNGKAFLSTIAQLQTGTEWHINYVEVYQKAHLPFVISIP